MIMDGRIQKSSSGVWSDPQRSIQAESLVGKRNTYAVLLNTVNNYIACNFAEYEEVRRPAALETPVGMFPLIIMRVF